MPPSASGSDVSFLCVDFCVSRVRILSEYGRTADGISDSMVIKYVSNFSLASWRIHVDPSWSGHSHISPFLFTKTLLPVLERTALEPDSDVRIVNVRAVQYMQVGDTRLKS